VILTGIVCKKEKKKVLFPEPPVSYRPESLRLHNKFHVKYESDSLRINSKPYIASDTTKKFDLMCSIVEIYDKNDSLLHSSIGTATNTLKVKQKYWLHPLEVDTFTIRTWGFGYVLTDDKESVYDRKKLYLGSTLYKEYHFPFKSYKDKQVKMDLVEKAQALNK
jgi:hypothetical protein